MGSIEVIKPGMYTTIQDGGRFNHQKSGVPVSGAMDLFSLKTANMLVGNREDEACFEITLIGPQLRFEGDTLLAITGGDMSPKLNGQDVDMWSTLRVSCGDVLSFGALKCGCRSYMAVAGGIEVPVVLGSKSTYARGKIGGFEGRALRQGDNIKTGSCTNTRILIKLPEDLIPIYKNETTIKVILGPQEEYFTQEGIQTFLNSIYTVTNEADRMGYRMDGPGIAHKNGADIVSDGIAPGSIQVPGHGFPIIMMADRQTTGGYTKIATVITPDINLIGQAKPGDKISFKAISIQEAHDEYENYMGRIEGVREYVKIQMKNIINSQRYKVRINSREFEVLVEELYSD